MGRQLDNNEQQGRTGVGSGGLVRVHPSFERRLGAWRTAAVAFGICVSLDGCVAVRGCCKVTLEQAVAIPSLEQACPPSRTDALCAALRTTNSDDRATAQRGLKRARAEAALAVSQRLGSGSADLWDPAVRFYLRERILGLLAWYVITGSEGGTQQSPDYGEQVSRVLAHHFPSYPAKAFPMATLWLPPPSAKSVVCPEERDLLLMLPGVARTLARDEFAVQMNALRAHFPCLLVERVNTLSFEEPLRNAERVRECVRRHPDAARIHMFGYSQGGLNALAALVEYPEIAARTRTVTFLDVPVHGSEVGEALYRAMRPAGWFDWLWPDARLPTSLDAVAAGFSGLGAQQDQLQEWLREEGAGENTLSELLRHRIAGVRSLGTTYAREFWAREVNRVPRTPLYAGFRAIITDQANLPQSNALLYAFTSDVEPRNPYNDMQVRLASQQMGGSLAEYEVLGPVAEGNHWQWALVPGDVQDVIMPRKLTEDMPHTEMLLSYYTAFFEIGLLGDAGSGGNVANVSE